MYDQGTPSKRLVGTFQRWADRRRYAGCVLLLALVGPGGIFTRPAVGAAASTSSTGLGPQDVLILVNADSPVSVSIADQYRRYYPSITDQQVLSLSGLPDSASLTATPTDEIITRADFEALIAQPVRDYLVSTGMVNTVYCIITTAGMPYRIEDTDPALADVVKPAASNPMLTVNNLASVDAASVESELSVLFQIDPALPSSTMLPLETRAVNPYQGYDSPIKSWAGIRNILTRRDLLRWTFIWRIGSSPKIEGDFDSSGYSAVNRILSPADIYLVARLDGPRNQGEFPIFAVEELLYRSARASDPSKEYFTGYNPAVATVVMDEAPSAVAQFAFTNTLNFPPQYTFLDFQNHPVPPGAEAFGNQFNSGNHFIRAFEYLTQMPAPVGTIDAQPIAVGMGGLAVFDDTNAIMNSGQLAPGSELIGLLTYGKNAGDGRPASYLLTSGPGGGPLFECSAGAVFASLESYNGVTMFSDATTNQGKIVDFISIGGSGAIGHAFEPASSGVIQGDFLLRNLLRDEDGDGVADMTFIEAAYTAMPHLSWSEVVIGDPLMRLCVGPGGVVNPARCLGDIDRDGSVDIHDFLILSNAWQANIGEPRYTPAADFDEDGFIGFYDAVDIFNPPGGIQCP